MLLRSHRIVWTSIDGQRGRALLDRLPEERILLLLRRPHRLILLPALPGHLCCSLADLIAHTLRRHADSEQYILVMVLAPPDIVLISSYLDSVLSLPPASAHPCSTSRRRHSCRHCPLDHLHAARLARRLLQPLRLRGSRTLLLPGQAALLLGVHLGRGSVAGYDASGSNVASLDGDALVTGEGRGDGCALDGVGAASSGASLGELGAWIV